MPKATLRSDDWPGAGEGEKLAPVEDQKIDRQDSASVLPKGQSGSSGHSVRYMRYVRGGESSRLTQGRAKCYCWPELAGKTAEGPEQKGD